MPITINC